MRNYVLVSYDISEQKRLAKVYKIMRGFGDGFQNSVFLCQISDKEEAIMRWKLDKVIKKSEDQIVIIHLGKVDKQNIGNPNNWQVIGRKIDISDNSILIV
ncbi:MAG: CRISPR-associated endonuclease Cas2 [Lachnospiraceae bacterium]|jgi:CRISPR-associated protein Cas2|nr:CRISPR-associated endonuclease Cas2 [Lachnospiraceae bacterium]